MSSLAATTRVGAMQPYNDGHTTITNHVLRGLYDFFVGWQSQRVLSEMRDDQLAMIGSVRASSGRVTPSVG